MTRKKLVSNMPDEVLETLLNNWQTQLPLKGTAREQDFVPYKLFLPWTSGTWLITELDEDCELAFGLCHIGFEPELGYFSLAELAEVRGPAGLSVEMDIHFNTTKPLSWWTADAKQHGRIRA